MRFLEAIFGWTHNANLATILTYVFYWLATIVALIWMKFQEVRELYNTKDLTLRINRRPFLTSDMLTITQGRTTLFGKESKLGRERRLRSEARAAGEKPALASSESPKLSESGSEKEDLEKEAVSPGVQDAVPVLER